MSGFDLLVGHLLGDYLMQNDWMAKGKKERHFICLIHCLIYTLAVAACSRFVIPWPCLLFIFATHFFIDRWQFVPWWMDTIGQTSFRRALAPWSIIAVDQCFHIVIFWIVFHIDTIRNLLS